MLKRVLLGIILAPIFLAGIAHADNSLNNNLYRAIVALDKAKVEKLIAQGADVNAKLDDPTDTFDGDPMLTIAVRFSSHEFQRLDVVKLLIDKGADVNAKEPNGNTPLHLADLNAELVELLIAKGADVNIKNKLGETPLQALPAKHQKDSICLLPDYRPDHDCDITYSQVSALLQNQIGKGLKPQQRLTTYLDQLKGHSENDELRKSIIALALRQRPAPAIPPEAEAAAGRAAHIFKSAKSEEDTLSAAKEFLSAIEDAPWVANYYYNLCTVLEKTPYTQQALHACKLYLVAAPRAADAGEMNQRIAELQSAADISKDRMKKRTAYSTRSSSKSDDLDPLYRFGGVSGKVSGKDIVLKIVVDWYSAPPKYQILVSCLQGGEVYISQHDLVSTDRRISLCKPRVNMQLVIKPEGKGFVQLSGEADSYIRSTFDDLFGIKRKGMEKTIMFSAEGDQGERFYLASAQGGDARYSGWAMYESECNGGLLKQDLRALPDDFVPFRIQGNKIQGSMSTGYAPEVEVYNRTPLVDGCTRQFVSKTGYHFGEAE
jgi:hypothetical protein